MGIRFAGGYIRVHDRYNHILGPSSRAKRIIVLVFIVALVVFVFAVVSKNVVVSKDVVHEAVIYTAFPTDHPAMGTANQPTVRELTRALLIIAAAWAERDQPLG